MADRNAAETLKGASLTVPRDQVQPLPDGSYYYFQIIGLRVRTEAGEELGEVREVIATGSTTCTWSAAPPASASFPRSATSYSTSTWTRG